MSPAIFWTHCILFYFSYGRCFSHWFMAMWCYWQMLLPCGHCVCNLCFLFGWCCSHVALLLQDWWWCSYHQADVLDLLADVIAILLVVGVNTLINSCTRKCAISVLLYFGRCYCQHGWCCCHDLIDWQMLLPCGWCYWHYFIFLACFGRCYCHHL